MSLSPLLSFSANVALKKIGRSANTIVLPLLLDYVYTFRHSLRLPQVSKFVPIFKVDSHVTSTLVSLFDLCHPIHENKNIKWEHISLLPYKLKPFLKFNASTDADITSSQGLKKENVQIIQMKPPLLLPVKFHLENLNFTL